MVIHGNLKPYKCTFEGCNSEFYFKQKRDQHILIHTERKKNHRCEFDNCNKLFYNKVGMKKHMLIHTTDSKNKKIQCDFPNCTYTCTPSNVKKHMAIHGNLKPYACTFEGCNGKFNFKQKRDQHMITHTPEGQIRQKREENRVKKILESWGHTIDVEVTINASRGKCIQDTPRYFSRLDFNIVNCVNAILILEVDEHQHYWYNLSCEFGRMSDVRLALIKMGYNVPIYWIRYNPNGKYHVGDQEIKISRCKRELQLKSKIEEICCPFFTPKNEVNIHYMFYDLISKDIGLSIMEDSDFPDTIKPIVSWNT